MRKNIFFTKKANRGFTLIELTAVIAVIGIIAIISWGTLGEARKKTNALNACEQVASMINKTRNYALSGRVPTATITINGTNVEITNPSEPKFDIPGGVSCTSNVTTYSYIAPDAVGTNTNPVICSGGGESRTVIIEPLRATCQ